MCISSCALQLDGGKPGAGSTSEGVLANFFSSLLSKKTGGTAAPGAGLKPTGKSPSLLPENRYQVLVHAH